jgi:hypothetical protein
MSLPPALLLLLLVAVSQNRGVEAALEFLAVQCVGAPPATVSGVCSSPR